MMKVGLISPVAWRTPPRHYGPWEQFVSILAEGLVKEGIDLTLHATGDSITKAKLRYACERSYEENKDLDPKICEYMHISDVFENANDYDILHNSFDFMPLCYSKLVNTPIVTTIHGFSSPKILPVYEKYNANTYYVSISDSDRSERLDYVKTVYHGINVEDFKFTEQKDDYLLFFGRIHKDKGAYEAIQIAKKLGMKLVIAGIVQDREYYEKNVEPYLSDDIVYIGSVGPDKRSEILGKAKVLLHPIHFEEPFGFSVVEAMACGTPVIAFEKGSMPELINHGVNGYLVDTVDEAVEYVKKLDDINSLACRNIVEDRFTHARMVKEYIEVYKTILNKKK